MLYVYSPLFFLVYISSIWQKYLPLNGKSLSLIASAETLLMFIVSHLFTKSNKWSCVIFEGDHPNWYIAINCLRLGRSLKFFATASFTMHDPIEWVGEGLLMRPKHDIHISLNHYGFDGFMMSTLRCKLDDFDPPITASRSRKKIFGVKDKLCTWILKERYNINEPYLSYFEDCPKVTWTRFVWNRASFPKGKFIFWMALLLKLKTKDKVFLLSWFLMTYVLCVIQLLNLLSIFSSIFPSMLNVLEGVTYGLAYVISIEVSLLWLHITAKWHASKRKFSSLVSVVCIITFGGREMRLHGSFK